MAQEEIKTSSELARFFASGHFGQARWLRRQGRIEEASAEQAEAKRWRQIARERNGR